MTTLPLLFSCFVFAFSRSSLNRPTNFHTPLSFFFFFKSILFFLNVYFFSQRVSVIMSRDRRLRSGRVNKLIDKFSFMVFPKQ